MGLLSGYRNAAGRAISHAENHPRVPLTAGQHILHLLLTVLTLGLWAPVWLIRAWRGNPGRLPVTR